MNSTRIGQLKNVQDGMPRPLGSQEIKETKVCAVLRDTMYFTFHKLFMMSVTEKKSQKDRVVTAIKPSKPLLT